MATLQQQITEKFLAKLIASGNVDAEKIAKLRDLMAGSKKIKAEDVVQILSSPADGDLE